MSQPSSSSPIQTGPIVAPAVNINPTSKLNRSFKECARKKSSAQRSPLAASLHFHEIYLKTRLEKTPGHVSTKQLLKEITDRGYRGKIRVLQRFLSTIRVQPPEEASLHFHKDYLFKRVDMLGFGRTVTKRLFEEIKAKGYQGAYKTLRVFLAAMRTKAPEESSFKFHEDYLIKRIKESHPDRGLAKQLFQEIKAKGYQGTLSTVQRCLSTIRKKKQVQKTPLDLHKEYLKKRVEEAAPNYVSAKQLFQEIKAKGYQGAPGTVRGFLGMIREKKNIEKTSLGFHREYLKKRVEEAAPSYVSTRWLLKEITDRGYRGSMRTLQLFLATIRGNTGAKKQTSALQPIKEHPCAEDPFSSPIGASSNLNALFDDVVEKDFLHSPFFFPLHSINSLYKTPTYQNEKEYHDPVPVYPACTEQRCKESAS